MVLRSAVRMCIAILSFAFTYLLTHFSLRRALFFCFPVRWVKVSRASLELRYVEVLSLKMLSKSVLNLTFFNFQLCPRVRDDLSKVKNLKSTDDKPCDILYTSVKSTLFLLSSKDHNFKVLKHSLYTIFCKPGIILVNRHCSFSDIFLSFGSVRLSTSFSADTDMPIFCP